MEYRQCKACRQPFRPRPQHPDQCFCPAAACQRERRRRWQAAKRQSDPDYRENQKHAQKAVSFRQRCMKSPRRSGSVVGPYSLIQRPPDGAVPTLVRPPTGRHRGHPR